MLQQHKGQLIFAGFWNLEIHRTAAILLLVPCRIHRIATFLPSDPQRVRVCGQTRLWRCGRSQGPLCLWQHGRRQVPHPQQHLIWGRGGVLHLQVPQLVHGGRVGCVRPRPQPDRPRHRGTSGSCNHSESENATSLEGDDDCSRPNRTETLKRLHLLRPSRCWPCPISSSIARGRSASTTICSCS